MRTKFINLLNGGHLLFHALLFHRSTDRQHLSYDDFLEDKSEEIYYQNSSVLYYVNVQLYAQS